MDLALSMASSMGSSVAPVPVPDLLGSSTESMLKKALKAGCFIGVATAGYFSAKKLYNTKLGEGVPAGRDEEEDHFDALINRCVENLKGVYDNRHIKDRSNLDIEMVKVIRAFDRSTGGDGFKEGVDVLELPMLRELIADQLSNGVDINIAQQSENYKKTVGAGGAKGLYHGSAFYAKELYKHEKSVREWWITIGIITVLIIGIFSFSGIGAGMILSENNTLSLLKVLGIPIGSMLAVSVVIIIKHILLIHKKKGILRLIHDSLNDEIIVNRVKFDQYIYILTKPN